MKNKYENELTPKPRKNSENFIVFLDSLTRREGRKLIKTLEKLVIANSKGRDVYKK